MVDTYEQWCQNNSNITSLARALRSSTPEQYIGYYLYKIFGQAVEYQKQFSWLGRQRIDIYLSTLGLAVEYDGVYYHTAQQRDKEKDKLCRSNGIRVIRIKEVDDESKYRRNKNTIYYHYERDYTNIEIALYELCALINKEYGENLHAEVDLKRDEGDILEYVQDKYYRKTLAYNWPEVRDYWLCGANKKSIFDVFTTSNSKYMLKCPRCGKEFVFQPYDFCYRRSLIPCRCEIEEIEKYLREVAKIYEERRELPLIDSSLRCRRLLDRMTSQVRFFWRDVSVREKELYEKLGLLSDRF